MNFNSILIGSEDPQRLVDYYTKLFGQPSLSGFPARFEQLGLHELKAWPSRELLSRGPRRVGIRLLGARSHLPRMASQPVE
jgi:hypothetical protein